MDGTLLDNNARVSATSAALISELTDDGALFTVATARTPASVDILLHDTRMTLPAIVMTGAALWDRRMHRYSHLSLMPDSASAAVRAAFARHGIAPFIYCIDEHSHILDVYHTRAMTHAEQLFYDPRSELPLKCFHLDEEPADDNRTILVFGTGDATRITALADELRRGGLCAVSCYPDTYNADVALIEVFAPGVSKAAAVQAMARECRADRVVVFGDNLNDLSMLAVADVAVAVANAQPAVLAAADRVIGRNSEDAVARFIAED